MQSLNLTMIESAGGVGVGVGVEIGQNGRKQRTRIIFKVVKMGVADVGQCTLECAPDVGEKRGSVAVNQTPNNARLIADLIFSRFFGS